MSNTIDRFAEGLKRRLQNCGKDFTCEGNPYANGCTETGFYADTVVDFDALCAEIDEFTKEFAKGA